MADIKKQFKYEGDKIGFRASLEDLKLELSKKERALTCLLDVEEDLDDETFISRANGYATTKWGKDVIEDRIELYKSQIAQIEQWITTF
jgi:hypothetical protein